MCCAHKNHFQRGVCKGLTMDLWDIGDPVRQFPRRKCTRLCAVHQDAPLIAAQEPQNTAKQRRLPRTVGAEHGKEPPFFRTKAHIPEHGAGAVCKLKMFNRDAHSVFSRFRIK